MSEIGSKDKKKGFDDEDLRINDNKSEKGHDGMLKKIESPKKSKVSKDGED